MRRAPLVRLGPVVGRLEDGVEGGRLTLPVRVGLALARPTVELRLAGGRVTVAERPPVGERVTVGARATVEVREGGRVTVRALVGMRVTAGARVTDGERLIVGERATVEVCVGARLTVPVRVGVLPTRPTVGVRPYVLGGRRSTVLVRPGA